MDRANGERFKGVNDLVFASNGDLYFTDQGQTGLHDPTGRLFRLRQSGKLELVLDGIPSPNGMQLKAGSKRHQHIVGFDEPEDDRTRFALVALDLPASVDKNDKSD